MFSQNLKLPSTNLVRPTEMINYKSYIFNNELLRSLYLAWPAKCSLPIQKRATVGQKQYLRFSFQEK